jgi:hypothetical protein
LTLDLGAGVVDDLGTGVLEYLGTGVERDDCRETADESCTGGLGITPIVPPNTPPGRFAFFDELGPGPPIPRDPVPFLDEPEDLAGEEVWYSSSEYVGRVVSFFFSFFFTFGDLRSNSSSDSETITVLGFLGFVIVFELFETAFGAHLAKNAFASFELTRDVFLFSGCFGLDLSGSGSLGILFMIYF